MKFTLGESPYPWEGRKLFCRIWQRGRGGGRKIKRLPGLIWKTEFMAVVKITTPVVHLPSFYPLSFFRLSPLFSSFIFILIAVFSKRFLRDFCAGTYKVKINFLIQRLIESFTSRCVIPHCSFFFFFFFPHQIRFSKLIDQLCRPARSKRTRGEKRKIIIDSLCALAVVSWQSASAGIYIYVYLVREIRAISLFFIRLLWSAARWHRMKRRFGHGRFTIEFADRYPRVK